MSNAYEQVQQQLRGQPKTWLVTGVAGFIGSPRMNFFPAEVLRQSAGSLLLPANAHTVGLRPEHVLLGEAGPLEYRVQQVEQMGSTSLLRGTLAGSASEG